MYGIIRFFFGLAVGSFLNVLAVRYNPDRFLLTRETLGGRSHCPGCKKRLSWYELVPIVSFVLQRGRCLNCKMKISWIYPLGELLSGLIFLFVPEVVASVSYPVPGQLSPQVILWILVFLTLQLMTFIDFRLQLVPDEGSVALIILGALSAFVYPLHSLGLKAFSFIGHYAYLFGFQNTMLGNRLFGVVVGALFFTLLILITRGKGMGIGDLKLSLGLGLLFGWPDIAVLIGIAFVLGAIVGGALLLLRRKKMKAAVPFVPFLAASAALVFFFGFNLASAYFGLLNL